MMVRKPVKSTGPDGKERFLFSADGDASTQEPRPSKREAPHEDTVADSGTHVRVETEDEIFYVCKATGKRDGLYRRWDRHSKRQWLAEECTYEQGLLQGQLTCWYGNGKMSRQSNYEKGLLFGLSRTWFPSGLPASEEVWDGGWYPRQRVEYYERYVGDGAFSSGGMKSLMWTIGEHVRHTIAWSMSGEPYMDRTEDIPEVVQEDAKGRKKLGDMWSEEKYGPLLWLQAPGGLRHAEELILQPPPQNTRVITIPTIDAEEPLKT